jgi:hypothetical protein
MLSLACAALAQHCINSYCQFLSDCGSGCNTCEPGNGVCSGDWHQHVPHSHVPHSHHPKPPHAHHPAPHSHAPGGRWPTFASAAELSASPWGAYYSAVYGSLPKSYPLDVGSNWLLHDGALIKAKVQGVPAATSCPSAELDRYTTNNMYQPPLVSWIWHAYPFAPLAANSFVEVQHEADPFGDEHYGMWLVYAPGSGIYFNLGTTISFAEHQDAYAHFNAHDNEAMSRAASAAGYDSVQVRTCGGMDLAASAPLTACCCSPRAAFDVCSYAVPCARRPRQLSM